MRLNVVTHELVMKACPPFASCHASSVLVLPNGDILAAWFGGTEEGAPDVAIWGSRCVKGQWSEPFKIADKPGIPHWNPVLFLSQEGSIYLFYKVGHQIPTWQTFITRSLDGGLSWTDPCEMVEGDVGGRGPVKNKILTLRNGRLLAPASLEDREWNAFVDISDDGGQTWTAGPLIPLDRSQLKGRGVIQPTLWESHPNHVHMLLRSTEGVIYRSDSNDGGSTWSEAYPTDLPNNNSGIDVVQMGQGTLALVYNPVGIDWGPRTPITLVISVDNGESWSEGLILESGEGEYSYPAVVSRGNDLFITYTWNRTNIAFWHVILGG